jgi:hypothetical protein
MHFEGQKQFLMLQPPHFSSIYIPIRPISLPSTLHHYYFSSSSLDFTWKQDSTYIHGTDTKF